MLKTFLIKHRSSGKFFHPYGGSNNPGNNTSIVLHQDIHDRMHWTFEVVDDYWGYIKHVSSGKIIHPYGGSLDSGNDTQLVLHSDRHGGALFALDAGNDHVVHKGGKYAHPKGGSNNPGNNTDVVLHSDVHDAMQFQFVSVCNPNKEELVYGNLKQKMPQTFLIKHLSSGKFFHPYGGRSNPGNDTSIVLHQDIHNRMHWTFEIVEDYWGYIKHVPSGKIIHPSGGCLNPGNGTQLVLHSDRHWGRYLRLTVSMIIWYKKAESKYAHPKGGRPNPVNNTDVVLHSDVHDAMRFQVVSVSDPNKEVLVYGNPKVLGTWKIINMVKNPLAEHVAKLEVKIGKSRTESTTTSFQYRWEMSMGIDIEMLKCSVSHSLQFMIEKSSSATWYDEATRIREIKVSPGSTVVTWQYVFDVRQNESMSVFQSNLLADTDSETKEPEDMQYAM